MITKILAAKRAARSGANTIIASGREESVLVRLAQGEAVGTHLYAASSKLHARKQWLADHLRMDGTITIDAGAVSALRNGKSLLPVGVVGVEGDFVRGDAVGCVTEDGVEVARGLVNYSSDEARRLCRAHTEEIEERIGHLDRPELIHHDNMVLR